MGRNNTTFTIKRKSSESNSGPPPLRPISESLHSEIEIKDEPIETVGSAEPTVFVNVEPGPSKKPLIEGRNLGTIPKVSRNLPPQQINPGNFMEAYDKIWINFCEHTKKNENFTENDVIGFFKMLFNSNSSLEFNSIRNRLASVYSWKLNKDFNKDFPNINAYIAKLRAQMDLHGK